MPGDLRIGKKKARKKNKQTNKKTKSSSIMDFVIMENEIRAASKHVPDVQKMAIALSTNQGPVVQTLVIPLSIPADK